MFAEPIVVQALSNQLIGAFRSEFEVSCFLEPIGVFGADFGLLETDVLIRSQPVSFGVFAVFGANSRVLKP